MNALYHTRTLCAGQCNHPAQVLAPETARGEIAPAESFQVLSTMNLLERRSYVAILPKFAPFLIFSMC